MKHAANLFELRAACWLTWAVRLTDDWPPQDGQPHFDGVWHFGAADW
jgi:hypothetical protein